MPLRHSERWQTLILRKMEQSFEKAPSMSRSGVENEPNKISKSSIRNQPFHGEFSRYRASSSFMVVCCGGYNPRVQSGCFSSFFIGPWFIGKVTASRWEIRVSSLSNPADYHHSFCMHVIRSINTRLLKAFKQRCIAIFINIMFWG